MTLTISEARKQLTSLAGEVLVDETVIGVTRRGEPVMALMAWEQYEAMMEVMEVLGDPDQTSLLIKGIEDVKACRVREWSDVKAELRI